MLAQTLRYARLQHAVYGSYPPKGLSAAREMYGRSFQPSASLKAMVYFEGGDLHTLTKNEKESLIAAASAVRDLPTVEIVSRELALA